MNVARQSHPKGDATCVLRNLNEKVLPQCCSGGGSAEGANGPGAEGYRHRDFFTEGAAVAAIEHETLQADIADKTSVVESARMFEYP